MKLYAGKHEVCVVTYRAEEADSWGVLVVMKDGWSKQSWAASLGLALEKAEKSADAHALEMPS